MMTDKQIIIDYKNLCKNYSKEVGCYNTFDGSCNKEQCFTYRLLQLLQAKEQECEELKKELMKKDEVNTFFNTPIEGWSNDPCGICRYKQTLAEIKEIVEKQVKRAPDGETFARPEIKQILQKISECELENEEL